MLAAAALASLSAGCDSGKAGAGSGDMAEVGDMGTDVKPGQLALRVEQARQHSNGDLELSITLANGTGGAPAALNPLLFSVRTSDGLLHTAQSGTLQEWVAGPACDAATQVGDGVSTRCGLTIDLKASSGPSELRYAATGVLTGVGDMRTATAQITVEPCTPCGDPSEHFCTYLDRDPRNCGACGVAAPANDLCRNGTIECPPGSVPVHDAADWRCVKTSNDPANCGSAGFVCTEHLPASVHFQACVDAECIGELEVGHTSSCANECAKVGLSCNDTWYEGLAGVGSGMTKGGGEIIFKDGEKRIYPCSYDLSPFQMVSRAVCACTT